MVATVDLLKLREALEASWDVQTAGLDAKAPDNPALGQGYATAWVVQQFMPELEIVKGNVWNGLETHMHFWNTLRIGNQLYHIDLTWQQFPAESHVKDFIVLHRYSLDTNQATVQRCRLLLKKVELNLNRRYD